METETDLENRITRLEELLNQHLDVDSTFISNNNQIDGNNNNNEKEEQKDLNTTGFTFLTGNSVNENVDVKNVPFSGANGRNSSSKEVSEDIEEPEQSSIEIEKRMANLDKLLETTLEHFSSKASNPISKAAGPSPESEVEQINDPTRTNDDQFQFQTPITNSTSAGFSKSSMINFDLNTTKLNEDLKKEIDLLKTKLREKEKQIETISLTNLSTTSNQMSNLLTFQTRNKTNQERIEYYKSKVQSMENDLFKAQSKIRLLQEEKEKGIQETESHLKAKLGTKLEAFQNEVENLKSELRKKNVQSNKRDQSLAKLKGKYSKIIERENERQEKVSKTVQLLQSVDKPPESKINQKKNHTYELKEIVDYYEMKQAKLVEELESLKKLKGLESDDTHKVYNPETPETEDSDSPKKMDERKLDSRDLNDLTDLSFELFHTPGTMTVPANDTETSGVRFVLQQRNKLMTEVRKIGKLLHDTQKEIRSKDLQIKELQHAMKDGKSMKTADHLENQSLRSKLKALVSLIKSEEYKKNGIYFKDRNHEYNIRVYNKLKNQVEYTPTGLDSKQEENFNNDIKTLTDTKHLVMQDKLKQKLGDFELAKMEESLYNICSLLQVNDLELLVPAVEKTVKLIRILPAIYHFIDSIKDILGITQQSEPVSLSALLHKLRRLVSSQEKLKQFKSFKRDLVSVLKSSEAIDNFKSYCDLEEVNEHLIIDKVQELVQTESKFMQVHLHSGLEKLSYDEIDDDPRISGFVAKVKSIFDLHALGQNEMVAKLYDVKKSASEMKYFLQVLRPMLGLPSTSGFAEIREKIATELDRLQQLTIEKLEPE